MELDYDILLENVPISYSYKGEDEDFVKAHLRLGNVVFADIGGMTLGIQLCTNYDAMNYKYVYGLFKYIHSEIEIRPATNHFVVGVAWIDIESENLLIFK